ncbi:MAG: winged helix-turn-helix domain-containing protein [Chitinophagaceae bacterium]
MKKGIVILTVLGLAFCLVAFLAFINRQDDSPEDHKHVVLRQIGHRLLWHAGDSSSRVMPIQQTNDNTYQIRFSKPFAFMPDSVISVVNTTLADGHLNGHYFVEMKTCDKAETVFAYEMDPSNGNVITCQGRSMSSGCYFLEIRFVQKEKASWYWAIPAAFLLALGGYLAFGRTKPRPTTSPVIAEDTQRIGQYAFDASQQWLQYGEETINLNENETLALSIFTENLHQTVTREQMMKQIWEDKGLIVIDRNVDVLVSKLRKKLQSDPSIKILNVHGRGYKMVIEA